MCLLLYMSVLYFQGAGGSYKSTWLLVKEDPISNAPTLQSWKASVIDGFIWWRPSHHML